MGLEQHPAMAERGVPAFPDQDTEQETQQDLDWQVADLLEHTIERLRRQRATPFW